MYSEWEVNWQPNVVNQSNYVATDFDTSVKTDEKLCDLSRTASTNMNAWSSYVLTPTSGGRRLTNHPPGGGGMPPSGGGGGEKLTTAAGIGLSGGYIYNALAGGNVDAVENEIATLDVCLSHPTPTSEFHYHFWSGCVVKDKGFWSNSAAPALCKDTNGC